MCVGYSSFQSDECWSRRNRVKPEMWKSEAVGKAAGGVYVHGMLSLDKPPVRAEIFPSHTKSLCSSGEQSWKPLVLSSSLWALAGWIPFPTFAFVYMYTEGSPSLVPSLELTHFLLPKVLSSTWLFHLIRLLVIRTSQCKRHQIGANLWLSFLYLSEQQSLILHKMQVLLFLKINLQCWEKSCSFIYFGTQKILWKTFTKLYCIGSYPWQKSNKQEKVCLAYCMGKNIPLEWEGMGMRKLVTLNLLSGIRV